MYQNEKISKHEGPKVTFCCFFIIIGGSGSGSDIRKF